MFETLASKTYAIVAASLGFAYIGCSVASNMMLKAMQMQDQAKISRVFWTAFIIDIIAFIALMFMRSAFPWNIILMIIFTLASGATLSIYFITNADAAQKALGITAATTLLTAAIATYSSIDFSGLGKILFIALIALIIISVIGLFIKIKGTLQRVISVFGVFIFTGYLLYDFGRLAKLKGVAAANTWDTALNFAISIYLDIINLFIQLVQLLGNSK